MPARPSTPAAPARGPVPVRPVTLSGWGRVAPTRAGLATPGSAAEAGALLRYLAGGPAGETAAIPRGLGRSYNNAAQSAGGVVISSGGLDRVVSFDPASGPGAAGGGG